MTAAVLSAHPTIQSTFCRERLGSSALSHSHTAFFPCALCLLVRVFCSSSASASSSSSSTSNSSSLSPYFPVHTLLPSSLSAPAPPTKEPPVNPHICSASASGVRSRAVSDTFHARLSALRSCSWCPLDDCAGFTLLVTSQRGYGGRNFPTAFSCWTCLNACFRTRCGVSSLVSEASAITSPTSLDTTNPQTPTPFPPPATCSAPVVSPSGQALLMSMPSWARRLRLPSASRPAAPTPPSSDKTRSKSKSPTLPLTTRTCPSGRPSIAPAPTSRPTRPTAQPPR